MTRKEELVKRAKEITEQILAEGVCLSNGECALTDEVILQALQQVEREVLGKVIACTQRYQQFIFGQQRSLEFEAGFRDAARVMEDWCDAQQQELGRLRAVNNDWQREFRGAVDSYNSLEQETEALREALQLLYDCQNGCPLPKYEVDWNRAMELSERALKEVS